MGTPGEDATPGDKRTVAVLVAAGRGLRARRSPGDLPKQFCNLSGRPVICHSIEALLDHPAIAGLLPVIHPDDTPLLAAALDRLDARTRARVLPAVAGGADRQESVLRGLEALAADPPARVLVHDAVRPFLDRQSIDAVLSALDDGPGACAGVPVVDTVKRADLDGRVTETVDRTGLWRAATPQGFDFARLLAAHRSLAASGRTGLTDDAAVAAAAGMAITMTPTSPDNIKLTTPEDFTVAEARLFRRLGDVRTGIGYDVHVLEPGDQVTLCGVPIPHTHRLKGHSDADVALHALTDALLGAIGAGDIGDHFPPSDPQWKGAPSRIFLAHAVDLVHRRGGRVSQADVTIIAEAPKIGPHRAAMKAAIAAICGITEDRVGVKATTNEGLGFAGRREGIAAIASATVRLPESEP